MKPFTIQNIFINSNIIFLTTNLLLIRTNPSSAKKSCVVLSVNHANLNFRSIEVVIKCTQTSSNAYVQRTQISMKLNMSDEEIWDTFFFFFQATNRKTLKEIYAHQESTQTMSRRHYYPWNNEFCDIEIAFAYAYMATLNERGTFIVHARLWYH